jgi:phosphoribosylformimino-5-aminoimidazole carboxamide ribotide isomerase
VVLVHGLRLPAGASAVRPSARVHEEVVAIVPDEADKVNEGKRNTRRHASLSKSSQTLAFPAASVYSGREGPFGPEKEFVVLILPAIDLRGGQCVRLRQGDYARETVYDADPAAVARRWAEQGAAFLHLVDLDGAREGHPVNAAAVRAIVAAVAVPCQLGGGVRSQNHLDEVFSWGVARVVLGTRALQDPNWCAAMCRRYPDRIVLGIDARDGKVATEGWLHTSERTAVDLAREASAWPPAAIVYTDISRDGMLSGPNVEATARLAAAVPLPVIASGGVSTLDDIVRLADAGLHGCIVGRALYEGRLELAAAIRAASGIRSQGSGPSSDP